MEKNTSILLGDYFENFVNEKINSGKYATVSEVSLPYTINPMDAIFETLY